ncbi:SAM-dependent methyltransferase, MidA [hydrothermal vent metagenome]|uniref:SAM-dependent methyltransferase, MidA n=1 Tax=hydrothermal vent metagenome TaxID=652676 RepID=A0A3B0Y430_9ZZZZ
MSSDQETQWNKFRVMMAEQGLGDLPEPDPAAWQMHSELNNKIAEKIAVTEARAIKFSEYMFSALYEPGLGYYSNGLVKFGADGDFVTAPELSPLFGACIANQIDEIFLDIRKQQQSDQQTQKQYDEQVFDAEQDYKPKQQDIESAQNQNQERDQDQAQEKNNSPSTLTILEFGPGSGALCISILRALAQKNNLPDSYYLLEVSPSLRQTQQENIKSALPTLFHKVQWLDELPQEITGVILANEVLDAMPVEKFQIGDDLEVNTLAVVSNDAQEKFSFKPISADFELKVAIDNLTQSLSEPFSAGYSSELNLWIEPWIKSLAGILKQGVALLIDYGYPRNEYYHPQRTCGTMMCHYRQRAHDNPLLLTGLQDITAYVDFTAVAEAADNYGLQVAGFTNQSSFLIACGLDTLVQLAQDKEPDKEYMQKIQQVKWLTLPSEMGDRFKVMALTQNYDSSLAGFSFTDFMHRL